ncbi:aminotransferase class V-fold PLP-dependent enzyme [Parachryseolinea silvisoli]|uniref:aminotransferase class V-fold PLP-dependent enzyme n=1 Tax=Parachryseolinea silvisoli TaxID=2873601 RepID=UPI002265D244|nr:aminotransferase class V-fold PLP-dependent enzyme [Parachryseolinea silvisoli]MCD9014197.1 aminotransferase class V-fold PLP-dependent enzyme [Parachryseolinea silvisoli]
MLNRRELLRRLSSFPVIGGIVGSVAPFSVLAAPAQKTPPKRDVFKELGVRTFINAAGTYTAMTGSLMRDEVMDAINFASKEFCMLDEVQDKVGEKLAKLVHSEAVVVTSGAFSGMTLGLAGVLTGMDVKKVEQLPHLEYTGMKSEVIIQKAHDIVYNHALTNTGCKIVWVETAEDVAKAVNERTALMHFLHIQSDLGKIQHEEWVALGKKYNVPTSIDIAADVPPVSNLWRFNDLGFSFVVISGGKAIRGPQSAGLLMGKKEIIAAARLHMPPRGFNIGRGFKINKEEILGMYVAIDTYIKADHDKEWKEWEAGIAHIQSAVKGVSGVTTEVKVPELGNHTPTLHITWNESVKITSTKLKENLRNASPSIEIAGGSEANSVSVTVFMLKPGQEKIVATRLKEELSKAVA